MHPRVYQEFEKICSERNAGGAVLEVGAIPSDLSLLCMKSLDGATEKVGINLDGPYTYRNFAIVKGNANAMDSFEDNRFDTVLCNAVLQHDKYFWKTIAEIKRVTKPQGLVVIGALGYTFYRIEKIKRILNRVPLIRRLRFNQYFNLFFKSTLTFEVNNNPGDYYRFSPQAFGEVLFDGMVDVRVNSIMLPPRIIGSGIKP